MKIALLTSTFLPRIGGAEMVVHHLARCFRQQGHDARVITWWGLWRDMRGKVPYPILPLLPRSFTLADRARWEAGRGSRAFVAAQLRALQVLHRFDVWNIHMAYPMGVLAVKPLRATDVPVVTTCHGDDLFVMPEIGYDFRLNPHVDAAIRDALLGSSAVTAISASVREEYRKVGIPGDRIRDVPNGVEVDRLRAGTRSSRDGRLSLLTVGRNHPQKGYRYIPGIAQRLAGAGLDFEWLIVGADTASVEQASRAIGLGDRVRALPAFGVDRRTFAMPPDPLVKLYQACDVFVLPSILETFGMVLIEAQAAGAAVVATRAPGCRDVIRDGETGLLAEPGDEADMARAILTLARDADRRERMARQAKSEVEAYRWENVAARYVDVYESVR